MIDFSVSDEIVELRDRVAAFVTEVCEPAEARDAGRGLDPGLRAELQAAARATGLLAPQAPEAWGGRGLDLRDQAIVLEAAGRSLLGPQALNCAAPDEGNMHLLAEVATPEQQERYLRPLVAGEVRSCFAMTEPSPGAGSDPSMLETRARQVDGGWSISGRKWFITGAEGAAFAICMARTGDAISRGHGATMLLVDADNPGMRIVRHNLTIDQGFVGGHCEVVFEDCRVPDDAVVGEEGRGYHYAQVRLGPARLTHCMRWIGLAARALDIATAHAGARESFGRRLGDHGLVAGMLADAAIDLETARLVTWKAAWTIDKGSDGLHASSLAKAHVAEAVDRVVDRAVQILGGLGVSHDTPVARFAQEIRPFRIYDGPTEVHKWSIGRRMVRDATVT